jgi:hypothetical protein
MNTKALNHGYKMFVADGYEGSYTEFASLMALNPKARSHAYSMFRADGYTGDENHFSSLVTKQVTPEEKETHVGIGGIASEYWNALKTGWITGRTTEEYLEVYKGNHDAESIAAMVEAGEKLNALPQSERMKKFMKKVNQAGGGTL